MKVEGYTINKLSSGGLFEGHIHEVFEPLYNQTVILFCNKRRYKECKFLDECQMCRPTNTIAQRHFLCLEGSADITTKMKEKIDRKLSRIFKKCRKVTITIKES